MNKALTLYQTTIGKKAVMAITGAIMLGFVLMHMLGNLQVFSPPVVLADGTTVYALDEYAAFLRSLGGILWVARLVLIGAIIAHTVAAISLVQQNRAARSSRYRVKQDLATSYAAKMMPWAGIAILLFLLYHLAHLTFHWTGPEAASLHQRVLASFQSAPIAGLYIAAQLALGVHIFHGAWSFLQSLGVSHPRYNALRKKAAIGFTLIVCGGNIAIPVAILSGIVK